MLSQVAVSRNYPQSLPSRKHSAALLVLVVYLLSWYLAESRVLETQTLRFQLSSKQRPALPNLLSIV